MSVTCLIPARGGSKGIPRKNLQLLGGIPLIDRAISTVERSAIADHIVVSTDDPEIASRAIALGATHLERPSELATDEASSESVLLHSLESLKQTSGKLLFVQTTTPLLLPIDIVNLAEAQKGFDSCFTVSEWHGYIWREEEGVGLVGVNHDSMKRLRRQDSQHFEFLENGAANMMSISGFLKAQHRFFGRVGYSLMPRLRSIEIDTLEDLHLAESLLFWQSSQK